MGALMLKASTRQRRRISAARAAALVSLPALALLAAPPLAEAGARAESGAGLVVIPVPASGPPLSYFKLSIAHGGTAQAGTIGLRNASSRRMRVALAAVLGQTLNTLGSTYAPTGTRPSGPARWLLVGKRVVAIAPGATVQVPVVVGLPRRVRPGDYLAGVSLEALGQKARTAKHGVAIASTVRYAIGVEVTVPGRRQPKIRFTGAALQQQPAGIVFLLDARNSGNVILQGVHGAVLITSGRRVIARTQLGPGTFVTKTAIAYPVPAFSTRPTQGTRFRIRALLRYAGGVARLDTILVFGSGQAAVQRQYVRPPRAHGGTAWWKIALLAAVIAYALATTILLLRRRRERRGRDSLALVGAARDRGEDDG